MMKILIVSDTHRKDKNLERVIEREKPLDMFIHLGDAEGSEYAIASWVNPSCVMEMVSGNNDFFSRLDREQDFMLGRYRVLLTHGHYYSVSVGTEHLRQEARARGARVVTGIGMLVQQGALNFTLWTGKEAPVQVMYDTLEREFGEA